MQRSVKHKISYKPSIVMEGAVASNAGTVARVIFLAAFVTLILGSKALLSWSNDLPIGTVSDFVLYLAQTWQDWMDKIDVTSFGDAIFDALRWFQALRWP